MKKNILLLPAIFIVSVQLAIAQNNSPKISQLIDSLSWNSISMDCMGGMLVLKHSDATEQELLHLGKDVTTQLVSVLGDKTKTVIAHIILTQIWEPEQDFLSTKYIYKDCDNLIGWHHVYNGIVWDWYEDAGQSIDQNEIDRIKIYWTLKLIDKGEVKSVSTQTVFDELERQDQERFPCNKLYDNNSGAVKFSELFAVLNKKADDPEFVKLWTRFGNDSTIRSYNDCFFINYEPEGLSFRFEKDSVLSIIFVEAPYAGELPYGLTLTDLQPTVDKKIGRPFKTSKYVGNTSNWYKDKNLFLDFDKNGKIIKFGISMK